MAQLSEDQMTQIRKFVETFPEEEREEKLKEVLSQLEEHTQTPQCPFCLMAEGKLKTNKVFEDKDFLAVLEINPANPGHTLLFPKGHVNHLEELKETLPDFFLLGESIASSLLKFNPGANILFSQGEAAGQRFDHLVVNILPRTQKDDVVFSWKPKQTSEETLKDVREKIIQGLAKNAETSLDLQGVEKRVLRPEHRTP